MIITSVRTTQPHRNSQFNLYCSSKGSLEICVSTYIFAKVQKLFSFIHILLQFPAAVNAGSNKNTNNCNSLSHKLILQGRLSIYKDLFLCGWFQFCLQFSDFSDVVNLLCSSPDTALHLCCRAFDYEEQ